MRRETPLLLGLLLAVCACTPLSVETQGAATRGDAAVDGGRGTGAKDSSVAADARPPGSAPAADAGNSTPARDASPTDASDAASSPEAGAPLDPPDSSTPVPDSGPPVAGAAGAPAAGAPAAGAPAPMCLDIGTRCSNRSQCCTPLSCDITSAGRVCCGETGHACAFSDGRDCCRNLLCINGRCGL